LVKKQEGSLTGYRILDNTDSLGAYCTKLFADLGADVIKIEKPEGDPGRAMPPFVNDTPHPEKSLYFLHRNTGKRGITLNLETAQGRDIFKRLVKTADVLRQGYL
jgi:crotonobetainyl-CoA:carnitine CoA-transferase CaiB-like acyl-CoA transferase